MTKQGYRALPNPRRRGLYRAVGLTLALAAVLVLPPRARAMTIDGPSILQTWADEAKVPTPNTNISFVEGSPDDSSWPCRYGEGPVASACALAQPSGGSVIYFARIIWDFHPRGTFYHEIGHVFDSMYLTDADRHWFAALLGYEWPWLAPERHTTAGEMFAEEYAVCALYGRIITSAVIIAPELGNRPIGRHLHRRFCDFIGAAYVN